MIWWTNSSTADQIFSRHSRARKVNQSAFMFEAVTPDTIQYGLGAIKAVSAASLALRGDGQHIVPLDAAIETMRQTGRDMSEKYKETSLGGLAVNVPNC